MSKLVLSSLIGGELRLLRRARDSAGTAIGGVLLDEVSGHTSLVGARWKKEVRQVKRIVPHLWYDKEAIEASELYVSTFPESKVTKVSTIPGTPSGDADVVSFELFGQPFMAISAGPLFKFNPSVSFLIRCRAKEEVDAYWRAISEGGTELMPLGSYPFSQRYGWTQDRYGLSWQIMLDREPDLDRRITPTLMFVGEVCGKAEEAITFYTSLFPNSKVGHILRYQGGEEPDREGTIKHVGFRLQGQEFAAMDSALAHDFGFNEAISLMVYCEDQGEIDHYWDGLSAVPESEQCGWLKDQYGLSWQVVPTAMDEMLASGTKEQIARVTEAFLEMKKFDIAELQTAYEGSSE
jgi:predicted 3-demethylubiquinone-9 3-methyltransferase (glyoxalase superfamily)